MKISVEWFREWVAFKSSPAKLAERLTMAGLEVKKIEKGPSGGEVFEIEITSNRPDWLSHYGVAREVSAIENVPLKPLKVSHSYRQSQEPEWKIGLENKTACPYYTGILIKGIPKIPTPDYMVKRLMDCGQRPISFLVDVTNYVLLLTGQPLHAFDARFLDGKQVVIRSARAGEKFTSLKEGETQLQTADLVIADQSKAVALAGVIGGKNSEILDTTQNVFLESAFFSPQSVRKTSLRTGLRTDSSYRFERRVDPEMVDLARDLAVHLIFENAHPEMIGAVMRAGSKPKSNAIKVTLDITEISATLGVPVPLKQAGTILKRLGLKVNATKSKLIAQSPSFRTDLTRPVDLVEEIARIYGYDKIPETLPRFQPLPDVSSFHLAHRLIEETQNYFAACGYFETVTFSLVTQAMNPTREPVILRNPQNQELNHMRSSMLHSLVQAVRWNYHHQSESSRFFEIANCYLMKHGKPHEEKILGVCASGLLHAKNWLDGGRAFTFYDLKGHVSEYLSTKVGIKEIRFQQEPQPDMKSGICQAIYIGSEKVGLVAELDRTILQKNDLEGQTYYAELRLETLLPHVRWVKKVSDLPKFPAIQRDMAYIVSEDVKAGDVQSEILKQGGDLLVKVELFDLFQGGRIPKGAKNLAFRMTYQSPEKTLIADEIHQLHFKIAKIIQDKFQATFQ